MELKLKNGDYVSDGVGGLRRVTGQEELLQRVLFRLTARRGMFPFQATLGSQLWELGQIPAVQRQSAVKQYVAEALAEEKELQVRTVTLAPGADGEARLTVELERWGEPLSVTLDIRT